MGAKCYDYFRQFVPLPSKQTLYTNFQQGLSEWGMALLGLPGVPEICRLFRRRHGLGDDVVKAVLGVDALAMEPVVAEERGAAVGDNHVFAFLVLPLKCELNPFPVHIQKQKSGNAGDTVKTRLEELTTVLADCGIKWNNGSGCNCFSMCLHRLTCHLDNFISTIHHLIENQLRPLNSTVIPCQASQI